MTRTTTIALFLRRPQPVREPLGHELGGTVVQLLQRGTTTPTWVATPEVLADALDGVLQKDTRRLAGESTARAVILTVLAAAGYSPAAAEDLLGRAFREPHRPASDGDFLESLAGGHALVVQAGHLELRGSCQCGRALGRTTATGTVNSLAALWERHTLTEVTTSA
ncbi:hypothetical protein [Streptomyces sp. NPDC001091]